MRAAIELEFDHEHRARECDCTWGPDCDCDDDCEGGEDDSYHHCTAELIGADLHDEPTSSAEFAIDWVGDLGPNDWQGITRILRDRSYYPSRRNGAHVHVSAQGVSAAGILGVARCYAECEDVLYAIATSNPHGHRGEEFAGRVLDRYFGRVIDMPASLYRLHLERGAYAGWLMSGAKYRGLNLTNATYCDCGAIAAMCIDECECEDGRTFEFRLWDASLQPERLNAYVHLSRAIVHAGLRRDKKRPLGRLSTTEQVATLAAYARDSGYLNASHVVNLAAGGWRDRRS